MGLRHAHGLPPAGLPLPPGEGWGEGPGLVPGRIVAEISFPLCTTIARLVKRFSRLPQAAFWLVVARLVKRFTRLPASESPRIKSGALGHVSVRSERWLGGRQPGETLDQSGDSQPERNRSRLTGETLDPIGIAKERAPRGSRTMRSTNLAIGKYRSLDGQTAKRPKRNKQCARTGPSFPTLLPAGEGRKARHSRKRNGYFKLSSNNLRMRRYSSYHESECTKPWRSIG